MRWGQVHGYVSSKANSPGPSANHPRGSGLNWEVYGYNGTAWYTWIGQKSSIIFGFAWRANLNPGIGSIMSFKSSGTAVLSLMLSRNGVIWIEDYNRNSAGASAKRLIHTRRWNYFEIKATFHPTAGTVVVHHNGLEVINTTGNDFGNSYYADNLQLTYGSSVRGDQSFDDMYLIDPNTSGASDFLGPIVVRSLKPTSDTATADFTPSEGSDHFAVVDDDRADGATYLESSTINDDDLFGFASIPSEIATLKGVSLETASAVTGSQPKETVSLCKSGSAALQEIESQTTIAVDFEQFDSIIEDDPDTGVPWTISGLNAAQFGVRHKG